jgi:hypothetical protein
MNGAELGLGITTAVLSLGAIASSLLSASQSARNAGKIADLDRQAAVNIANMEAGHNLRTWQRTVMFPEGLEIISLLGEFSDALITLSLDKDSTGQLASRLGDILRLRSRISNRVVCFTPILETPTELLAESLTAFERVMSEVDQDGSWLAASSFRRSLDASNQLMISIRVAMAAESGFSLRSTS